MAYTAIDNTEIEVDDAITQSLMQKVKDNFDYLYTASSGSEGFLNPSFDTDADSDGDPDNWTVADYAGGSHSLDATNAAHGAYALKFVHPGGAGNGGGYAESDYIPCNEAYQFKVEFLHKCSISGVKNQIVIRYFSEAKVDLSADETIYSETTNPTSWSPEITEPSIPPATAQYMKIKVVGGFTDTDPGSSTNIWFDGLRIVDAVFAKDRTDTSVYLSNNVLFENLDTNRDISVHFVDVGYNNAVTFMKFSADNGATYVDTEGVVIKNGTLNSQTSSVISLNSTTDEWISGGYLTLKRLPDGTTRVDAVLLTSADGGATVSGSTIITAVCQSEINSFMIYAGGNFDQATASVSIYDLSG